MNRITNLRLSHIAILCLGFTVACVTSCSQPETPASPPPTLPPPGGTATQAPWAVATLSTTPSRADTVAPTQAPTATATPSAMPSLLESLSSGLYIVYAGVDEKDQVALYVISMDGTLEGQLAQGGGTYVRLSPDGKHVAFSADAYTTFSVPLSVLDLEDNATTRIAAEKPCDHPTWSSDGMKLAAGCSGGIYLISVPDGKMSLGIPESTSEFPEFPDWSPDGRWLSYYAHLDCQCTSDEIGPYLVEASCLAENSSCGTSDRRRLGQLSLAAEGIRAWSPDSLELAVWSDSESIFVFEVASGHLQRKLDVRDYTPVRSLAWSPDGKWLAVVQENLRAPNRLEVIPSGGGKAVLTYVDERSKITGIFWLRIP